MAWISNPEYPQTWPTLSRFRPLQGGARHSSDDWTLITGKVKILNGYTIVFADGTKAEVAEGIELERQGIIADETYPAGREAAEFLRKLIGDREVTMYVNGTTEEYRTHQAAGKCYIGSTNLNFEVINGWAFATHTTMVPAEIMARENKRGIWRGKLVPAGN